MAYRKIPLVTGEIYHVFNRGVEKREIFTNYWEYQRFFETFRFYQVANPPTKFSLTLPKCRTQCVNDKDCLVEFLCYCLMPNHFHLIIKQLADNGISIFMRRFTDSYTRYFNTRNNRVGPLFQGSFKAVRIVDDEQLLHLSRYIHLNPYVANLTNDINSYQWSSYHEYIKDITSKLCNTELIMSHFKNIEQYKKFTIDYADYARTLGEIKNLQIDE